MTKEWLGRVAPDLLSDEETVRWYISYVMRGASPGAVAALWRMNQQIDIRDVLPTIAVPTLVTFRSQEYFGERTRFMGEQIPGAHVVELPGNDHLPWEGDREALLDEVERFLAGVQTDVEPDRVLATLLFTDIVGSTAKAAELGDRAWQDLLTKHDRARARPGRPLSRSRSRHGGGRDLRDVRRSGARGPLRVRRSRTRSRRSGSRCERGYTRARSSRRTAARAG